MKVYNCFLFLLWIIATSVNFTFSQNQTLSKGKDSNPWIVKPQYSCARSATFHCHIKGYILRVLVSNAETCHKMCSRKINTCKMAVFMNEEVLRCSDFSQQYSIEVELAYLIKLLKDNLNLRVALHSIGVVKWDSKSSAEKNLNSLTNNKLISQRAKRDVLEQQLQELRKQWLEQNQKSGDILDVEQFIQWIVLNVRKHVASLFDGIRKDEECNNLPFSLCNVKNKFLNGLSSQSPSSNTIQSTTGPSTTPVTTSGSSSTTSDASNLTNENDVATSKIPDSSSKKNSSRTRRDTMQESENEIDPDTQKTLKLLKILHELAPISWNRLQDEKHQENPLLINVDARFPSKSRLKSCFLYSRVHPNNIITCDNCTKGRSKGKILSNDKNFSATHKQTFTTTTSTTVKSNEQPAIIWNESMSQMSELVQNINQSQAEHIPNISINPTKQTFGIIDNKEFTPDQSDNNEQIGNDNQGENKARTFLEADVNHTRTADGFMELDEISTQKITSDNVNESANPLLNTELNDQTLKLSENFGETIAKNQEDLTHSES